MLSTRYKLPPLADDDVAMGMERDMLSRWGFLGLHSDKHNNGSIINNVQEPHATTNTDTNVRSNGGIDVGDADENDKVKKHVENIGGKDILAIPSDKNESEAVDNSNVIVDTEENNNILGVELESDLGLTNNEAEECVEGNIKIGSCSTFDNEETKQKQRTAADVESTKVVSENEIEVTETEGGKLKIETGTEDTGDEKPDTELENVALCVEGLKLKCSAESVALGVEGLKCSTGNMSLGVEGLNCSTGNEIMVDNVGKTVEKREMKGAVLELYEESYRHYDANELCESLLSVEEALEMCESGGQKTDDVKLWLLRSKVLNSMEDYREALRSAYKVKAKERPSRLWVEGAIAMEKLGLLVTAELWVAMAMHVCAEENSNNLDPSSNDIMCVLRLMQTRLRVERTFGSILKDKPLRVAASVKYNRSVFATKKIKKGEAIFQELPEVIEQSIQSHKITACAGCAKSLVQLEDLVGKESSQKMNGEIKRGLKKMWPKRPVVPCPSCSHVKYCSQNCRDRSWESHHKVICPSGAESPASMLYDVRRSFRDVMAADGSSWQGWWNAEFSPTILSRMTAMVLCNAHRLADLRSRECYNDSHWSMCEAQLEKYSPCEKMKATENIPKMHDLLGTLFKRSKFLRYDITNEQFDKFYSQAATNVITFHDKTNPMNNLAEQVKKDTKLLKKLKKIQGTNTNTKDNNILEKSSTAEFHGLFPLACCLNHSCFPNAKIESTDVEGLPGIAVVATRDIKVGEEVFVSYVEPLQERETRRGMLWRKYKFICDCSRCLHEGIGPHVCTNCGKNTKKVVKKTTASNSKYKEQRQNTNNGETTNGNISDGNHTLQRCTNDHTNSSPSLSTKNAHPSTNSQTASFTDVNDKTAENTMSNTVEENAQENAPIRKTIKENAQENAQENAPLSNTVEENAQENAPMSNTVEENAQENASIRKTIEEIAQENASIRKTIEEIAQENAPISNTVEENAQENASIRKTIEEIAQENAPISFVDSASMEDVVKEENKPPTTMTELTSTTNTPTTMTELTSTTNTPTTMTELTSTTNTPQDDGIVSRQDKPHTKPSHSHDVPTAIEASVSVVVKKFGACGRCKRAWYCSPECQKESWASGHKKICTPR